MSLAIMPSGPTPMPNRDVGGLLFKSGWREELTGSCDCSVRFLIDLVSGKGASETSPKIL
ncbi:hypothetical protein PG997_010057 [Apiospora hydei]|uniref:Uncharacterized protein n=1 Tax=Apiospora hydei TaxID=1337664 RepID=A0ABR1VZN7_9PEZI